MAYELIYTSAERGVRPGARGFCTVSHTRGMAPATVQILEALSSYKSLYSVHAEQQQENPVAYSHYRSTLLGRDSSILSRVSPVRADHTGRSNKLAHHVLLHAREYPAAGPLWLSRCPGFFLDDWDSPPQLTETPKAIPASPVELEVLPARGWAALTGDAGNASHLADLWSANADALIYVVFAPGMDVPALLSESMSLLPVRQRWRVTYSTYCTSVPAGVTCACRCCLADEDLLREARRQGKARVLDLTVPLAAPESSPYLERARRGGSGVVSEPAVPAAPVPGVRRSFVLMPQKGINMLNLKPRCPEE